MNKHALHCTTSLLLSMVFYGFFRYFTFSPQAQNNIQDAPEVLATGMSLYPSIYYFVILPDSPSHCLRLPSLSVYFIVLHVTALHLTTDVAISLLQAIIENVNNRIQTSYCIVDK